MSSPYYSRNSRVIIDSEASSLLDEHNKQSRLWDSNIQVLNAEDKHHDWPQYENRTYSILFFASSLIAGSAATVAIVYMNGNWNQNLVGWFSFLISFIPLITLQLFLGVPQARAHLNELLYEYDTWVQQLFVPIIVTLCWFLSAVILKRFDPLAFLFVFFISASSVGALRKSNSNPLRENLTWTDMLVWLLLFVPLDYRWYGNYLWIGVDGMSYDWWASAISVLAVAGFADQRHMEGFGYRLIPRWRDLIVGVLCALALWVAVVPLGILAEFLTWPGWSHIKESFDGIKFFCNLIEIFFTVAITEELFFRNILLNGLHQTLKSKYPRSGVYIALVVSSLFFGVMHWPRRHNFIDRISFAAFGFLGGISYGSAYLFSGSNILACSIAHALTDTLWSVIFP